MVGPDGMSSRAATRLSAKRTFDFIRASAVRHLRGQCRHANAGAPASKSRNVVPIALWRLLHRAFHFEPHSRDADGQAGGGAVCAAR
jgi:hypothetical protein